jgi:hypothetical protein
MRPTWETAPANAQGLDLVEGLFPRVSSMEVRWSMITINKCKQQFQRSGRYSAFFASLFDQFPNVLRSYRHIKMLHSVR